LANVCCLGGLQHHLMNCVRHNKVCMSTFNVFLYLCRDQHGHPSCFWDRCIDERQVSILVPDGHQVCHDDNRILGVQLLNNYHGSDRARAQVLSADACVGKLECCHRIIVDMLAAW
jgi:hypothetical protein